VFGVLALLACAVLKVAFDFIVYDEAHFLFLHSELALAIRNFTLVFSNQKLPLVFIVVELAGRRRHMG